MRLRDRKANRSLLDPTARLVDGLNAARKRFNRARGARADVELELAQNALFASTPTTPDGLLAFVQCVRYDYDAPATFDVIERALRGMPK